MRRGLCGYKYLPLLPFAGETEIVVHVERMVFGKMTVWGLGHGCGCETFEEGMKVYSYCERNHK